MSETWTDFFLFSKENRLLYPPNKYPIIHSIAYQNTQRMLFGAKRILKYLLTAFVFILYLCQTHTYLYNAIYGPFHLNFTEFIEYLDDFKRGFHEFDYIQVEIGEKYLQNFSRQFDGIDRSYHLVTTLEYPTAYMQLLNSEVFVKLHRHINDGSYERFGFDFSKFSLPTLYCISDALGKNNLNLEKSDLIKFINFEYDKNIKLFNPVIMEKCGIFIGYCNYETIIEAVTYEKSQPGLYYLGYNGVIFNSSESYFPFYSFTILFFCCLCFLFACIKFFRKTEFESLALFVPDFVKIELEQLNYSIFPLHEQLLKLDRLINAAKYAYKNQLFVVQNEKREYFFVILQVNRNEIKTYQYLPFTIYKISNIFEVTNFGIYDIENAPLRHRWPPRFTQDNIKEYRKLVHKILLDASPRYKKIHNDLVKQVEDELDRRTQKEEDYRIKELKRDPIYLENLKEKSREIRAQVYNDLYYSYFIKPVSPKFFAHFQFRHSETPTFVDEILYDTLQKEKCTICWDHFVMYDRYAIWPCSSIPSHHFHFKCIERALRKNKNCPLCRKPAAFENLKFIK